MKLFLKVLVYFRKSSLFEIKWVVGEIVCPEKTWRDKKFGILAAVGVDASVKFSVGLHGYENPMYP